MGMAAKAAIKSRGSSVDKMQLVCYGPLPPALNLRPRSAFRNIDRPAVPLALHLLDLEPDQLCLDFYRDIAIG